MNIKKIIIFSFFMILYAQSYLNASVAQPQLKPSKTLEQDIEAVKNQKNPLTRNDGKELLDKDLSAWDNFNTQQSACITLGNEALISTQKYEDLLNEYRIKYPSAAAATTRPGTQPTRIR